MRCVAGGWYYDYDLSAGECTYVDAVGLPITAEGEDHLLPIGPVWPGFAVNTVFYAAFLWLLIPGPFALRRFVRRRRGLCPACGYDLRHGEHGACPECGVAR